MKWVKQTKSIHERPKDILTRDTIGHLECDSIVVVARHRARWQHDDTGIAILSLATDQGCEFSALPALLPDCLYACDPEKPTQKGQVGYMNKLIRQYIPKAINLRNITQAKLDWIANELKRPRKRLGRLNPGQVAIQHDRRTDMFDANLPFRLKIGYPRGLCNFDASAAT